MKIVSRNNRVGYITTNLSGYKMECVEYYNARNITVKFENGYIVNNI